MSQGNRISAKQAYELATKIKTAFFSSCVDIAITGSVRRRADAVANGAAWEAQPTVGDIEILMIPKSAPSILPGIPGLNLVEQMITSLVRQRRLIHASKNEGEVKKVFYHPYILEKGLKNFKIELIITNEARWPIQLAQSTGPAILSKGYVTLRQYHGVVNKETGQKEIGLLPAGYRVGQLNGEVWQLIHENGNGPEHVPLATEEEFICFVNNGEYVRPGERDEWAKRLIENKRSAKA